MSMTPTKLGCTGCDFIGFLHHRPTTVIYRFADGAEVASYRNFAWCLACDGIRDVEARAPGVAPLQAELAQLQRLTPSRAHAGKHLFSELTGIQPNEAEKKMARIEGQIRLSLRQGGRSRCLQCGSLDTLSLMGFVHRCGGTLRPEPDDPEAPCFFYREDTIFLDEDGRVLLREINT